LFENVSVKCRFDEKEINEWTSNAGQVILIKNNECFGVPPIVMGWARSTGRGADPLGFQVS
jgi:hypothetical protein